MMHQHDRLPDAAHRGVWALRAFIPGARELGQESIAAKPVIAGFATNPE